MSAFREYEGYVLVPVTVRATNIRTARKLVADYGRSASGHRISWCGVTATSGSVEGRRSKVQSVKLKQGDE